MMRAGCCFAAMRWVGVGVLGKARRWERNAGNATRGTELSGVADL
jgi:hypothetical protein